MVHLPKEGIVFTGDIVAGPIPLIGSTSFPLDYGPTLEKLLALKASVYVPGTPTRVAAIQVDGGASKTSRTCREAWRSDSRTVSAPSS